MVTEQTKHLSIFDFTEIVDVEHLDGSKYHIRHAYTEEVETDRGLRKLIVYSEHGDTLTFFIDDLASYNINKR